VGTFERKGDTLIVAIHSATKVSHFGSFTIIRQQTAKEGVAFDKQQHPGFCIGLFLVLFSVKEEKKKKGGRRDIPHTLQILWADTGPRYYHLSAPHNTQGNLAGDTCKPANLPRFQSKPHRKEVPGVTFPS
jgi:hypothetical protein